MTTQKAKTTQNTYRKRTGQANRSHPVKLGGETKSKRQPNSNAVRFIAFGGLEEIGRNMMVLEYRDDVIVVDAGLQFPEEDTPGIDYIIPNTSYLELKKRKIRGLIITHGHYDHIGAIPYVLEQIGNPTIYATELAKEIIMKRQSDFPNAPKPNFHIIKGGDKLKFSDNFSVEIFSVEHSIPEGFGLIFNTPVGKIVHPGEFKFDYGNDGKPKGLGVWENIGKQGIHTLMLDITNSSVPGWSVSERVVERELEKIFKSAEGRIIVGTFSSLLDRIAEIIKIGEKLGRVVMLSGYSLKSNVEIARRLGLIKVKKGTIVPVEEIRNYKDDKILILSTGAQGEEKASLMRIISGGHRQVKVKKTDTFVFSSSVIPGNERSIQNLKDNLARQGAHIYDYKMLDIHSSGHAPQEELKKVMELVNPKHFLPIHGNFFMRWQNAQLAKEAIGLANEKIVLADNGLVVEIAKDGIGVTGEEIPASYVLVDGLGVGDVGEVVLRDRRTLADGGMVVIIAVINKKTGQVLKNPDIISRGFVYLRDNQDLLTAVRNKIRNIIKRTSNRRSADPDYIKALIRDQIGEFLFKKTQRRPMILPVIIEL